MKPVTLKSLAKELNLTEATVSRALNDYSDISANTKQRVNSLAIEKNYFANTTAKRLASGKSETIGYIMPWDDDHNASPYLYGVLEGLVEVTQSMGYDLIIMKPRNYDEELALFTKLTKSKHLEGIIISRTLIDDPRIDWLKKLNIPFVSHGRSGNRNDFAWYDVDNFLDFENITNFLIDLGHRKIAKISGPKNYNFVNQRISGYKASLDNHGLNFDQKFLIEANLSIEGGRRAAFELFKNEAKPTAICCVSDIVAIGCMQALNYMGLKVGSDVSVVGYDGLNIGEIINPKLTTMVQPVNAAGKRLGSILFELIGGASSSNFHELSEAKLVVRESTNPPLTT